MIEKSLDDLVPEVETAGDVEYVDGGKDLMAALKEQFFAVNGSNRRTRRAWERVPNSTGYTPPSNLAEKRRKARLQAKKSKQTNRKGGRC